MDISKELVTPDVAKFISKTNAEEVIKEIAPAIAGRAYSDLYKTEADTTYQYINFVQEGGGVMGVALVGYSYVLERLGFRFLKLAGTSAGAINTMLIAGMDIENYKDANGQLKYQYKSEMLLHEMLAFDLWKLVDGHWFAKKLIAIFTSQKSTTQSILRFIRFCLMGSLIYAIVIGGLRLYQFDILKDFIRSPWHVYFLIAGAICSLILSMQWIWELLKPKKTRTELQPESKTTAPGAQAFWIIVFLLSIPFVLHALVYYVIRQWVPELLGVELMSGVRALFHLAGGLSLAGLVFVVVAALYFGGRFSRAGYGINPGNTFRLWMEDILKRNGVATSEQLESKLQAVVNDQGLQLRDDPEDPGRTKSFAPPYISVMTSDVTLQTKAEFPLHAANYWENANEVNPAEFVRASMSIPLFFSPHKVCVKQDIQNESALWQQKGSVADIVNGNSKEVWFVDGGALSNFPINIFHNPNVITARVPTFGVKLEDEKHIKTNDEYKPEKIKFLGFLGNLLNTMRNNYDKDFLKRNSIYEKCIAHIDMENVNWLDFGMSEKTKIKLFNQGVAAAKVFLTGGEYWVDGKMHDSRKYAVNDEIGKAFANGYNWEAFKKYRKEALEKDMEIARLQKNQPADIRG